MIVGLLYPTFKIKILIYTPFRYIKAKAFPNKYIMTTPYKDAAGTGIMITMARAIKKQEYVSKYYALLIYIYLIIYIIL